MRALNDNKRSAVDKPPTGKYLLLDLASLRFKTVLVIANRLLLLLHSANLCQKLMIIIIANVLSLILIYWSSQVTQVVRPEVLLLLLLAVLYLRKKRASQSRVWFPGIIVS